MSSRLKRRTTSKKNLIQKISNEQKISPQDVKNVIQSFLNGMTDALAQGDRIEFRDFGVFEIVERKKKIGRNPKNPTIAIEIPAHYAVKFNPGKKLREVVGQEVSEEN